MGHSLRFSWCLARGLSRPDPRGARGWVGVVATLRQDDDLGRVDQAGAEADLQGQVAALRLALSNMRSMASGMEAAEVFPVSAMSRATGSPPAASSGLIIASVIRMLAWCGMNTSSSSALTPARRAPAGRPWPSPTTAQRKTVCPSIVRSASPGGGRSRRRPGLRLADRLHCRRPTPRPSGRCPGCRSGRRPPRPRRRRR